MPFAPGGGTDNLMRTIVGIIDENKWSPVAINVVNRAGGSGVIGYTYLLGKKGDRSVIAGGTPGVVSLKIEGRLPGNHHDMTMLMIMAIDELMLSVRSDSKYQTIEEFVKAAKERPGQLSVAGTGTNTEDHIFTYLFEKAAGIKLKYVPVQLGRRVHGGADGRARGRRRDEPQRDRGPGRGQEGQEPGGRRQEAADRRARHADLRRAWLRVLLGADARRRRARRHERPRP